jgi:hypothetical protein
MTADPMPTSVLAGSLTLILCIPLVVGCLMYAVVWLAGRVK